MATLLKQLVERGNSSHPSARSKQKRRQDREIHDRAAVNQKRMRTTVPCGRKGHDTKTKLSIGTPSDDNLKELITEAKGADIATKTPKDMDFDGAHSYWAKNPTEFG